ncbi:hypothetical protein Ataiwa_35550 [Algoriphagus taiwanensis]|uniref:Uncharacterized protein n=1 Tax=Algoriphagus taiwanensis TaxID=1445656 RepID=A0ABQ6Q532_9BACT|nr:hypothetical protein Ataiwa_35550 [Algoriphagus taiwanensis]
MICLQGIFPGKEKTIQGNNSLIFIPFILGWVNGKERLIHLLI